MTLFTTPRSVKTMLPVHNKDRIASARTTIGNILHKKDPRILLVVGPCSIHSIEAAKEYAKRLHELSQEVGDVFFICMRTYFEKSRTSLGWKGLLYDPYLDGSNNLQEGIRASRELLVYLSELGLPAATEFLEPLSLAYIADTISWGAIGARTCQSPIHRQFVSSLEMPVGFKNRSDGNIDIAIQACLTARERHNFLGINDDGNVSAIEGKGNELVHLILRGSERGPNYDAASIKDALERLKKANLLEALVVDCSHDNSRKNYMQQQTAFTNVIEQIASTNSPIRGIMLESFIEAGSQGPIVLKELGQSITDPCLDWNTTKQIIRQGADKIRERILSCV